MKPIRIFDDIYTDYQRVYFSYQRAKNDNSEPRLLFNIETVSNELQKHSYDIVRGDKDIQSMINISSYNRLIEKERALTDWLVALYGDKYPIIDLSQDNIREAVREILIPKYKYRVLLVKRFELLETIPGHIILREIATGNIKIIWNNLDNNNMNQISFKARMEALFSYINENIGDCGIFIDDDDNKQDNEGSIVLYEEAARRLFRKWDNIKHKREYIETEKGDKVEIEDFYDVYNKNVILRDEDIVYKKLTYQDISNASGWEQTIKELKPNKKK